MTDVGRNKSMLAVPELRSQFAFILKPHTAHDYTSIDAAPATRATLLPAYVNHPHPVMRLNEEVGLRQ